MYKTSSESMNHIARTGSSATKGAANGGLVAPPNAVQAEEYFNTIRHQYDELNAQYAATTARLEEIKLRLRDPLPFNRFEVLRNEHERVGARHQELQREVAAYRVLARMAAMDAFGGTFYEVAKRKLDPALLRVLEYETEMMLGRGPTAGIPKGRSECGDKKQESLKFRGKEKLRRQKVGARRARDRLVWSDERDRPPRNVPGTRS